MGLVETLAVVGRVGVEADLLLPGASHDPRDQPALGDHVDHGDLLGELEWAVVGGEGVAQLDDLGPFGDGRQNAGPHRDARLHAVRRVVVLVDHDAVEADLLRQSVLGQPLPIEAAPFDGVEELVREQHRGEPGGQPFVLGVGAHRLLGEVTEEHVSSSLEGYGAPGT